MTAWDFKKKIGNNLVYKNVIKLNRTYSDETVVVMYAKKLGTQSWIFSNFLLRSFFHKLFGSGTNSFHLVEILYETGRFSRSLTLGVRRHKGQKEKSKG